MAAWLVQDKQVRGWLMQGQQVRGWLMQGQQVRARGWLLQGQQARGWLAGTGPARLTDAGPASSRSDILTTGGI